MIRQKLNLYDSASIQLVLFSAFILVLTLISYPRNAARAHKDYVFRYCGHYVRAAERTFNDEDVLYVVQKKYPSDRWTDVHYTRSKSNASETCQGLFEDSQKDYLQDKSQMDSCEGKGYCTP